MISVLASILIISYLLLILYLWLAWERILPSSMIDNPSLSVSVLIAVRNEGEGIGLLLEDLQNQNYPSLLFEVIIINDHSTDSTIEKINTFMSSKPLMVKLLNLDDKFGKKAAMKMGVAEAKNDIILTTDGDCRVPANWLDSMTANFLKGHVMLVSGPVRMQPQDTFFHRLQGVEFSSLIAAGAATMRMNWPTMANAANMAIRRSAYRDIDTLSGKASISGDDVFLLHRISKMFDKAVIFCREQEAIVETKSADSIRLFFEQRKRWASKWQFYDDAPTIVLALFILLVNLITLLLPIMVLTDRLNWQLAANLFLAKLVFEYWFLKAIQKFFKSRILLLEFVILAIIYPLYVSFVAFAGLIGKLRWKGRISK